MSSEDTNLQFNRLAAYLTVALPVALLASGCDSLDLNPEETIFLTTTIEDICFEFNGLAAGQAASSSSDAAEPFDLGPFLDGENFSKSDVVAAQVTFARLRMVFPIEASLSSIREVSLQLNGTSGNDVEVARAASFIDTNSSVLNLTEAPIARIIAGPSFGATLSLIGSDDISEDVVIEGEMTVRIEVAGL